MLASEGRSDRLIPHALYHAGADGEIESGIGLPAGLTAIEPRFGFGGISRVGDWQSMAAQRDGRLIRKTLRSW